MEVGEVWAYRAKATMRPARVEVLRLGTSRPLRVKVRFLDEGFEGREEWVPPARLKVLWASVEEWEAREARWHAVREASLGCDSAESHAASVVLDTLRPDGFHLGYNRDSGVLLATDLDAVVRLLDTTPEVLTSEPLAFVDDDGTFVAPWSLAERVVVRLAEQHADRLLDHLAKQDEENRQHAIYGYYVGGGRGREDTYISPEICAEVSEEFRPAYDLVRQWCGAEATAARDELLALREEVVRLGRLIEEAARRLREAGQNKAAVALEAELGVPIETVRAQRDSGP